MKIYNLEKLVKVEIEDKNKFIQIYWKEFKKRKIWPNIKEGYYYYNDWEKEILLKEEDIVNGTIPIENLKGIKFQIFDKKVYFKPNVTLYFENDISYNKVFDTIEEAEIWGRIQAEKASDVPLVIN